MRYVTNLDNLLLIETNAHSSRVSMLGESAQRYGSAPFFEQEVPQGIDPFDAHMRIVREFNSSVEGEDEA